MATSLLDADDVRIYLSDYTEKNPLLGGVRWTDKQIEKAQIMAVDRFNLIQPTTYAYTVENFPSAALLLMGVCGWLLKGEAVNQASNQLSYQANGVTIDDYNKAEVFTSLGKQFWDDFMETSKNVKVTQNISRCFGSKGSDYSYLPVI